MTDRNYGIWIASPGEWTGWLSMVLKEKQYPMRFSKEEAERAAENHRKAQTWSSVEIHENPPEELPWSEEEWRKATA